MPYSNQAKIRWRPPGGLFDTYQVVYRPVHGGSGPGGEKNVEAGESSPRSFLFCLVFTQENHSCVRAGTDHVTLYDLGAVRYHVTIGTRSTAAGGASTARAFELDMACQQLLMDAIVVVDMSE